MAVTDVKFSNFADGGDLEVSDIVVGLRNGVNTRFNYTASPGLYLPLAGGTMAGTIDMDNNSITGIPTPVLPSDAVPFSSLTALGTPSPLTRVDDTNVTLTLGGTPATALLQSVSLTLGWTGQLGLTRGGTNASLTASNGGIVYSTATAMAILSGTATARQMLQSGASAAPAWSTATWPATTTANQLLYSSATNTVTGLASAVGGILVTDSSSVPVWFANPAANNRILLSVNNDLPSWSTAQYPSTAGSSGNVLTSNGTNWVSSAPAASTGFESSLLLMGG